MLLGIPTSAYRYQAFISYSHEADGPRAAALQKTLEQIARPWYRARSLRVFRDDTDLAVSPGLETEIFKALKQSEWLVLVASPKSASSVWVAKEVEWWLTHRTVDTILLVKTEGEILWDPIHQDFDWKISTAISTALKEKFSSEPLFLDLSSFTLPEQLDPRNPEFRGQVLKIAARLLGKSPVDIESEDLRQVRRNKAWATVAFLATAVAAGVAFFQWHVAERRADQLEAEALRARSSELAASGRTLATSRTPDAAIVLARHALTTDRSNPDGMTSTWSILKEHLCTHTFRGNRGAILSAVFSPDGSQVLTANEDGTAQIWEIDSGNVVTEFKEHREAVTSAVFSPDGNRILTASNDGTARVWHVGGGEEIAVLRGHRSRIPQAVFSSDSQRIATASYDHTARIWDVSSGELLFELGDHPGPVRLAAFDPDGFRVLTCSQTEAKVWDVVSGKMLTVFQGHKNLVSSAAFSPDGKRIVTASDDHTARIWDASTGSVIVELTGHHGNLFSATFSPDGSRIVTASLDRTVRVFDADTGEELAELRGNHWAAEDARFSPDGGMILTIHQDFTARLWDMANQELLVVFGGHGEKITSAVFSDNGQRVLTASRDGTSRIWSVSSAEVIDMFADDEHSVHKVAFGEGGRRLLTQNSDIVRSWDLSNRQLIGAFQADIHLDAIAVSPDGRRILTGDMDGEATIWNADTGKPLTTIKVGDEAIIATAFAPDGQRVVVGSGKIARVCETGGRQDTVLFEGHDGEIESASFSPDGGWVVTASQDGTAKVWATRTGRLFLTLQGHKGPLSSAVFSSDGHRVVTASHDDTARVWDAQTGRPLAVLSGHSGVVLSAHISPDGLMVATASFDSTVRLWDVETGILRAELRGHRGRVRKAIFSPDGSLLATTAIRDDNVPLVWDAHSGRLILELRGHRRPVEAIAFSPDGRLVTTGGEDGKTLIWDIGLAYADSEELMDLMDHRIARLGVKLSPDQCQLYFSSLIGTRPAECARIVEASAPTR